jgi:hypothetical protein
MPGGPTSSSTGRGFLDNCRSACGGAGFFDEPAVNVLLMAALVICSSVIALYEFRLNPLPDTERGEWTGRQLFYAPAFTISFFVAFIYILTVIF